MTEQQAAEMINVLKDIASSQNIYLQQVAVALNAISHNIVHR